MRKFSSYLRCLASATILTGALVSQVQAASISGQGTWESTLQARDLDGNSANGPEAYYDTALNITWLADAFQARTALYQARPYYAPGDSLIWPHAVEWANNLTLYGISDWRLPKSFDTGIPGCNAQVSGGDCGFNVDPNSSEMAHMFFVTLGNSSYLTPQGTVASGGGLTNTGSFSNVYAGYYWSETEFNSVQAWNFNFAQGSQSLAVKTSQGSAVWAVLDGDRGTPMAPVPEPESYAMLLAGLGLIGAIASRRKHLN